MAKVKFYVVFVGKEQGVFTDWGSVKPLVNGHKGAKHMSFGSLEEATHAYDNFINNKELPEQLQG